MDDGINESHKKPLPLQSSDRTDHINELFTVHSDKRIKRDYYNKRENFSITIDDDACGNHMVSHERDPMSIGEEISLIGAVHTGISTLINDKRALTHVRMLLLKNNHLDIT